MTRSQTIRKRDKLVASLAGFGEVLRGSLVHRWVRHTKGCPKCAAGGGHPLWVLNVNSPGGKNKQISVRAEQATQVQHMLDNYRQIKETLEAISKINQELIREDRVEAAKAAKQEHQS